LRNGIHVDYRTLIASLSAQAEAASGLPLLRIHWYDSAKDAVPDLQQRRIGELPRVKLRLGRFGVDGHQKGVDLRIGLDLVTHARNGTADVFFLVSGDDDLTEAVEEAQVHGVQVVILAVPDMDDKPHGVSHHLLRAADELLVMPPASLSDWLMKVEAPQPDSPPAPETPAIPTPKDLGVPKPAPVTSPAAVLAYSSTTGGRAVMKEDYEDLSLLEDASDAVARRVLGSYLKSAAPVDVADLRTGKPFIPGDIDRALLLDLSDRLGTYDLSDTARHMLRSQFWRVFDELT
jgi:uncharacterized LabA/DUF88 family protein